MTMTKKATSMPIDEKLIRAARKRIADAQTILIVSHVGPDGDAVCSTLGLGLALEGAGKTVHMVLSDGVSYGFEHLTGVEMIVRKANGPFDLVISVDCADRERLGSSVPAKRAVDINIDHHMTNTMFGELNLVDPSAVAACAQVAEYLEPLGLKFSPSVVDALFTGLLTDTLGFRTSNMTPKALRLGADLMERGADVQPLYERALLRRSLAAMRYWGAGLSKLQMEDGLLWTTLTLEDRKRADYSQSDDAELINSLAATEGAKVTLLFIEQDAKQTKVSWRSRGDYDVATLATTFGGGGHRAASGATVDGSLAEVQEKIIKATRELLAKGPN
jgi:phosphoesterase RecJ-like protein